MTDIHSHILYGLDDGSDSLAESVMMARSAYESGTRTVIATPHTNIPGSYENYWGEDIISRIDTLNEALKKENIKITVYPGQEVFSAGDVVRMLREKEIITLNFSRYLLTEFDFYEHRQNIISRCEELTANGYVPVIAHPERYECLQEDEETVFRIKELGCLFQINKGSLLGFFGSEVQETAHAFVRETLADFVASDAHSPYMRTAFMADAHEMVSDLYSPDYADFLFRENPSLLLQNKTVNSFD